MPFITEEIYSSLPGEEGWIMVKDYPEFNEKYTFPEAEESMQRTIDAIKAIRVRRAEMGVVPSRKAKLYIETKYTSSFENSAAFFEKLASASSVELVDDYADESAVKIITDSAVIHIPLGDLVDFEAERARLSKELAQMESEIKRAEGKLSNEGFISRAPAAVVEAEKQKLEKYKEKRDSIREAIAKLG
ncbi:MAG: class I tRNA ligase family protein, partial [Eubacteriales bacterium]